ncbi:amidase signature domain-containing protein [Aspergillus bertholletiae]|uniref:Amidase signature domain-containing protein n=1 Tax=Aspergillus bertholletiae TaxID=1226010 RepID=A0A5N7BHL6_9EURO|nr:amidase signature domain-containing protein [Aspergillus bertholletiae]
MSWETIGKEAQAKVLESIPARWRLDAEKYRSLKDVTSVPYTSGILTDDQLRITELTVVEIVKRLESRELKAVQVLEAFAARAAIAHQLINCLTDWFYEDGVQQAKDLDTSLDKGGKLQGPLHGVPIALKDSHELKGHAVTMGYVSRRDNIAKEDSNLVKTLRTAGAVFFCKTTMPQSGMALETVSNLWGRTVNPFNRELGAGGSSGGDATLVALRGSPIAPSTDMGGSIRVPAAFNGLYAIRPTSDRIPKGGMTNTNTGNLTIKLSCGPVCHSLDDLKLFTRIINAHPLNQYDSTSVPVPWRKLDALDRKLTIGILKWDGVVMPHPPVLRALEHTKQTLEKAGHEVITFDLPLDCWDIKKTTFDIYYQSGSSGTMSTLAASGEPTIPAFADLLRVFNTQEHSAAEALRFNLKTRALKEQFADVWNKTADGTTSGRAIDALILPPAPAVGYPHDFNIYWGYTSLFNLLDYPSVILPVANFKVDPQLDPVDPNYRPVETNPYDKPNHELYDPNLFVNQPSTIQIVGRPFEDEETIQVASVLDALFKAP